MVNLTKDPSNIRKDEGYQRVSAKCTTAGLSKSVHPKIATPPWATISNRRPLLRKRPWWQIPGTDVGARGMSGSVRAAVLIVSPVLGSSRATPDCNAAVMTKKTVGTNISVLLKVGQNFDARSDAARGAARGGVCLSEGAVGGGCERWEI